MKVSIDLDFNINYNISQSFRDCEQFTTTSDAVHTFSTKQQMLFTLMRPANLECGA